MGSCSVVNNQFRCFMEWNISEKALNIKARYKPRAAVIKGTNVFAKREGFIYSILVSTSGAKTGTRNLARL